MATVDDVIVQIGRYVREELKKQIVLEPTHQLVRDLELDSVTMVALFVALEDHYRVFLKEEEAPQLVTVLDLAELVVQRTGGVA